MDDIQWTHAKKADGTPFVCFETFNVHHRGEIVGMIQCRGPCFGPLAERNHRHGPWIAFVGPDSDQATNLPGLHETQRIAAGVAVAAARGGAEP